MSNYLVTGGAGFIGSNIVEALLKRGDAVRVIDNFSTGRRSNLEPFLAGSRSSQFLVSSSGSGNQEPGTNNLELVEGDIRSLEVLRSAMSAPFGEGKGRGKGKGPDSGGSTSASTSTSTSTSPHGVDFVLHQAALPSVPRSIQDPVTTHEVNSTGTLNVLIAARDCGVKRVVYASSSSVYGDSEELPKHEGMTPNPMSPYACAKLAGEHYCRVFSRLYGLETVALRYFNVFGPRQDPGSQYAAVIPKFIAAIREGRQPVIYGDGEQSRDFTPVANVVAANLAACKVPLAAQVKVKAEAETGAGSPHSTLTSTSPFLLCNVAVGERYTLNYLVREICRIVGKHVEPIYEAPRPGDVKHSLASVNVLKEQLGLRDLTSFPEGLAKLCATGEGRG